MYEHAHVCVHELCLRTCLRASVCNCRSLFMCVYECAHVCRSASSCVYMNVCMHTCLSAISACVNEGDCVYV